MPASIAPSSRPPPTSGGGIYVFVAVALVMAIIGLVYWKLKGSDAPANALTPPPMVNTGSQLAEQPPPPPPIEEPTAVVDAGPTRVATTNYGPCQVNKCGGSINTALSSAVSARAGSARPCYERALRVNASLQGKLTVSVRVDPSGNVCSASITQDAVHSPEVSNCVTGMFRSAKFPPPTGGCMDVNIPLNFTPREGK
ncbi:MAG TPA: AgmX/PglI C-terminal domain-containing protein [Polyangiaceae bacterium]|nr:AgmX/PglI C-terminal domain-containing protein [Polyangiaceae bacterium]